MADFSGKTIIITGGARGIGLGIAKAFAKQGGNITITSIVQSELNDAQEKLSALGAKVLAIYADGGNYEQVKSVVQQTVDTFGGIDVLVNNAQASKSGVNLVDLSVDDFKLAIDSGLYAAFFYMKECFPYLQKAATPE